MRAFCLSKIASFSKLNCRFEHNLNIIFVNGYWKVLCITIMYRKFLDIVFNAYDNVQMSRITEIMGDKRSWRADHVPQLMKKSLTPSLKVYETALYCICQPQNGY